MVSVPLKPGWLRSLFPSWFYFTAVESASGFCTGFGMAMMVYLFIYWTPSFFSGWFCSLFKSVSSVPSLHLHWVFCSLLPSWFYFIFTAAPSGIRGTQHQDFALVLGWTLMVYLFIEFHLFFRLILQFYLNPWEFCPCPSVLLVSVPDLCHLQV